MREILTRRRFLAISAASVACAGGPGRALERVSWTGRAMGADVGMTLRGPIPETHARSVFRAVEHELARLERIFSLYQPGSQIVQLNRTGILKAPAPEFVDLLSLCDRLHAASGGAFDPTVQPLWLAHAAATAQGDRLSGKALEEAHARVGWRHLRFDSKEIRFDRAGCGLTLNGIAQGHVTDRIAGLLRRRGLDDVLIDMGEIAALGARPWQVGVADPNGDLVERLTLQERALATSAPMGTLLAPQGGLGHILDPRDVAARPRHRLVSVSAPGAAVADGLSTAACLMDSPAAQACVARFPGARLETVI